MLPHSERLPQAMCLTTQPISHSCTNDHSREQAVHEEEQNVNGAPRGRVFGQFALKKKSVLPK